MKFFLLNRWSRCLKESKDDVVTYNAFRSEIRFLGIRIDHQNHKEELRVEGEKSKIGFRKPKNA